MFPALRWLRRLHRRSYELLSQIVVGSGAARLPPLLAVIIGALALAPHAPPPLTPSSASPSHGAAAAAAAALSAGRFVDAVAPLGILQVRRVDVAHKDLVS